MKVRAYPARQYFSSSPVKNINLYIAYYMLIISMLIVMWNLLDTFFCLFSLISFSLYIFICFSDQRFLSFSTWWRFNKSVNSGTDYCLNLDVLPAKFQFEFWNIFCLSPLLSTNVKLHIITATFVFSISTTTKFDLIFYDLYSWTGFNFCFLSVIWN